MKLWYNNQDILWRLQVTLLIYKTRTLCINAKINVSLSAADYYRYYVDIPFTDTFGFLGSHQKESSLYVHWCLCDTVHIHVHLKLPRIHNKQGSINHIIIFNILVDHQALPSFKKRSEFWRKSIDKHLYDWFNITNSIFKPFRRRYDNVKHFLRQKH